MFGVVCAYSFNLLSLYIENLKVVLDQESWLAVGCQENKNKRGLLSIGKGKRLEVKEGKTKRSTLMTRESQKI